jgi:hypothetical protein
MRESIARVSDPVARAERLARHDAVAALAADGWVELRADAGLAAGDPAPQGAVAITGDLSDSAVLERVRSSVHDGGLVTVFDALEYQRKFQPLLETLRELAAERGVTVVIAVPNDAFGSIEGADRPTTWEKGAVEELRSLLPVDHRILHQVALRGTAIVPEDYSGHLEATVALDGGPPPVGFLVAFGPRAEQLGPVTEVVEGDLSSERAVRRAAESELAFLRASMEALEQARAGSDPTGAGVNGALPS